VNQGAIPTACKGGGDFLLEDRMKLYLIRHGETEYNRVRRLCGHTNLPLNERGRKQAEGLRERFKSVSVNYLYSSDLRRAEETAQITFPEKKSQITTSALIRELDFGEWEGRTSEEIIARDEKAYKLWLENPALSTPPRGESLSTIENRVKQFLREIVGKFKDETVAVVTHSGPIRVILCDALGIPSNFFWRIAVNSAGVSIIDYSNGKPFVSLVNDTGHIEQGG
jgi:alpha-ribazole phosphatase